MAPRLTRSTPQRQDEPAIGTVASLLIPLAWLFLPFALWGTYAQDGTAFLTGASLARTAPDIVYSATATEEDPAGAAQYVDAYCQSADGHPNCRQAPASFLSTPAALPVLLPLTPLPNDVAIALLRFVAAGCCTAMMLLLRSRLAADQHNALALTGLLATPLVLMTIVLGQNTPALALSAAVGIAHRGRLRSYAHGAGLAILTALKLFPLLLLAPAIALRRHQVWGATLAVSGLLAAASLPFGSYLWSDLATALWAEDATVHARYQISLFATLQRVAPGASDVALLVPALLLATYILVWRRWVRHLDSALAWAWAWAAAVTVTTNAWPHYLLVPLPFLLLITLHTDRPKVSWIAPVFAATTVPVAIYWGTNSPAVALEPLLLVAMLLVLPVMMQRELSEADRDAQRAG